VTAPALLRRPPLRRPIVLAAALLAALGCAPQDSTGPAAPTPSGSATAAACTKDTLRLVKPGTLTVGTDKPAYEPWFADNDPTNGRGFESAVAYAVADRLGFAKTEVHWVTVPFNASFAPGRKTFDFDINQVSITDARKKAVDFSTGYYDVTQAVVALKTSKVAGAKSLADLKSAKLGAQVGTTSLQAIRSVVAPTTQPAVFNDNNDTKTALQNGQIDAAVFDLPTAFYLTAAEIEGSTIVGQFPSSGPAEQFGLLFEKGNALVGCVDQALAALKSAGELARIQGQWLSATAGAPELR
jgi:polar amino acid transport system substrate-binding protein